MSNQSKQDIHRIVNSNNDYQIGARVMALKIRDTRQVRGYDQGWPKQQ